jgi:pimeloyl-ACP methyl ester carboxylesterase
MKETLVAHIQFGRFFRIIIPAAAILFFGIAAFPSFIIYKVMNPGVIPENVNPSLFLLTYVEIKFPDENGKRIEGWMIPGTKGAPGIILSPGYGMSRADTLSLAVVLHERGFNLLMYSQRGSGISRRCASTLGLRETDDLSRAIRYLQTRGESDRNRIGIWGVDVGAFAALHVAADFKEIRAIAVDSIYENISDFLNFRIAEDFGIENGIVHFGCFQIFRLTRFFSNFSIREKLPLDAISRRPVLFLKGDNRKRLASLTADLYDRIQPQKEMISFKTARIHLMSGEDLKSYDRQVAGFFVLNLL